VTIDLNINEEYESADIAAYEGPITIQKDRKKIPGSFKAASTIFVDKI
ncbi:metal-dependent transcriptional regulator, partial [Enterococcus faecium]